ncbi:serine palmitoyltransferase small subunit B [Scaptodrosophila lebanonensis]|uniref:Serine palmitoyltransferase small subunit B n=1 Tax=Drosophila lebanonensis TaxID=7225 RepID=A0A6J2T7F5_DROLE|nr:serine palmitoyltransferase small subunit B [Scaptodrosophila lebanonensis]
MLKIKRTIANLYRQYELATCISMFEPWEKKLINGFVLVILALLVFSSCVYLPTYMQTLLQFITPLPWSGKSTNNAYAPIASTQKMNIG